MVEDEAKAGMLVKVRALLAKAQETEFPEEAAALTTKANELMLKYGINEALAKAKAKTKETPTTRTILIDNPYRLQKTVLLQNIIKIFGGSSIRTGKGAQTRVQAYGFDSDLMFSEVLWTSLNHQAVTQSLRVPPGIHGKTYRASFWVGFNNAVLTRLRESKETVTQEATTNEPGTALVLYSRQQEAESMLKRDFPRTKTIRTRSTSADGYNAGKAAGNKANLYDQDSISRNRPSIR